MKNLLALLSKMLMLLIVLSINQNLQALEPQKNDSEAMTIWASSDLMPLAKAWAEAYQTSNPNMGFNFAALPGGGEVKVVDAPGSIMLIKHNKFSDFSPPYPWCLTVGREIVVPIMNVKHPLLSAIQEQGLSASDFSKTANTENISWGEVLGCTNTQKVEMTFVENDKYGAYLQNFLKVAPEQTQAKPFKSTPQLLQYVSQHPNAIGFCSLTDLIDEENQQLTNKINFIPIDINNNNRIDYFENIYDSSEKLTRGAWIGKYPDELQSRLYFVAKKAPVAPALSSFIEWTLSSGQPYLLANGFNELVMSERFSKHAHLHADQVAVQNIKTEAPAMNTYAKIGLIILIIGVVSFVISWLFQRNRYMVSHQSAQENEALNTDTIEAPAGLYYDDTHTWSFLEKNGKIQVGIDDFIQHVTGPISRIELKLPGDKIKKGEPFLSIIQEGKKIEINAPFNGTISERNSLLINESSLINTSPYQDGWIYLMESEQWQKELKHFKLVNDYKAWIKNEFSRLKDFLASATHHGQDVKLQPVLQDGGELRKGVLLDFGPEIWEEFQYQFINRKKH